MVNSQLIQNAVLASDMVAIAQYPTEAQRTRAIVTRAIEFLIGNGLVVEVPQEEWPMWLVMDPPFTSKPFPTDAG